MPQLTDLVKKRTDKKFIKKEYRPWDLSGTGTIDQPTLAINDISNNEVTHQNVKEDQIVDNKVKNSNPSATFKDNDLGNDLGNKQVTIRQQSDNNQITLREHLDNIQVTNREQSDDITDNVLDNVVSITFLTDHIRKLTGIQQKIFFYIIDLCSSRGQLDTGVILTNDLTQIANCSFGSAKTSLSRLINKNLVVRKRGKTSRGGHIILGITKEIQAAALQAQRFNLNPLKGNSLENAIGNKLDNTALYSSSNINNITTTKLPLEWEEIEIDPSLAEIGFSKTQLLQLYSKQLNIPEVIQESINHFAFALKNNPKVIAYTEPLNVIMGVLRKGMSWFEKNYISPKEKALEELLNFKKQESERIQSLEKKLFDEEYKDWANQLSKDKKEKILDLVPKTKIFSKNLTEKANEGFLIQHFKDHIYKK